MLQVAIEIEFFHDALFVSKMLFGMVDKRAKGFCKMGVVKRGEYFVTFRMVCVKFGAVKTEHFHSFLKQYNLFTQKGVIRVCLLFKLRVNRQVGLIFFAQLIHNIIVNGPKTFFLFFSTFQSFFKLSRVGSFFVNTRITIFNHLI